MISNRYNQVPQRLGYVMKVLVLQYCWADTLRHGSSVSIAATGEITCPKLCLLNYFEAAKIPPDSENFIFRPIIKTSSGYKLDKKRKLSYTRTREIFLERLQDLGLDKSNFGPHSLRSGGASAACKAGMSDRLIMKHGRWKSEKSKDRYIHETVQQKLSVTRIYKTYCAARSLLSIGSLLAVS